MVTACWLIGMDWFTIEARQLFRGGTMKRAALLLFAFALTSTCIAGFKPKNVRAKKPEQYQVRTTVGSVTYAADLLLEGKDQKDFFYKELTPSNIIAVRLAVFNNSKGEVVLPMQELQLLGPSGKELPSVAPEQAAQAVLQGLVVTAEAKQKDAPVSVGPSTRTRDRRSDKTDPQYDPRLDPNDPSYDPTDPRNRPVNDPRYGDPRYDPRYGDPRYDDPRYGGYPRPGVDVIMNPRVGGGGGGGDMSQFEKQLVEKDFDDKAHSTDPIDGSMIRDRFLYFSMKDRPVSTKGFTLRLPKSKGIPEEVILRF